jgi:prophage regulatory protein
MTTEIASRMSGSSSQGGAERDARGSRPSPAFFRLRDVLRITSLSRPTLYRRIAARRFPAPVHLGGRARGWASASLQAWIDDPEGYSTQSGIDAPARQKRGVCEG